MIKINNLTKKFGSLVAIDNLNLDIPQGEIFGFLGPNGAGKTTTIKIMCGLMKPTAGEVLIDGHDIQK
ncbi:MAG: ATP-binding cassette domain-containing protein, partial [bacterium]